MPIHVVCALSVAKAAGLSLPHSVSGAATEDPLVGVTFSADHSLIRTSRFIFWLASSLLIKKSESRRLLPTGLETKHHRFAKTFHRNVKKHKNAFGTQFWTAISKMT